VRGRITPGSRTARRIVVFQSFILHSP